MIPLGAAQRVHIYRIVTRKGLTDSPFILRYMRKELVVFSINDGLDFMCNWIPYL